MRICKKHGKYTHKFGCRECELGKVSAPKADIESSREEWMREVTDILVYQPSVPMDHKQSLVDAFGKYRKAIGRPLVKTDEDEKELKKVYHLHNAFRSYKIANPQIFDCETLGMHRSQHRYLENRIQDAFESGWKARDEAK